MSFKNVPIKSIPLYRNPNKIDASFPGGPNRASDTNIFMVSLEDEKNISLNASNDLENSYPVNQEGFVPVTSPFNGSSDRVQSITHAINPSTGQLKWYAVVRPLNGSDQIWTSNNKVDWTRCSINSVPSSTNPLRLKSIKSSTESDSDSVRLNGLPVICAVGGIQGSGPTIIRSLDMETFEFVDNPLFNDSNYLDASFEDTAYGDDISPIWIFTSLDDVLVRNLTLDIENDPADWEVEGGTDNLSYGSIAYGEGIFVAAYRRELNDRGMVVSTDNGQDFLKPAGFGSSTFEKVRYTDGYWVCAGEITSTGAGSIYYSTDLSTNIDNWNAATITQNNYKIIDIDYGNGIWYAIGDIPPSDPNSSRVYYTNGSLPSSFYHDETILPSGWSSSNIEYGGGLSREWLITSRNTANLKVNDFFPFYSGGIFPEPAGTATNSVGSITDTYYDGTGTLITNQTELWQCTDSSISYKHYFQNEYENVAMFVGADSFGDLWEMDSDIVMPFVSRISTYQQVYSYPGTYRLERTDWLDPFKSSDWEYWIKDFHIDQQDSDLFVGYSIVRRKDVPEEMDFQELIKVVGQDSNIPAPDLNPTGELGIQDFGETYVSTARKMLFMGYELLGIGEVMILIDPEVPTDPPYNKSGSWLRRGYALDTRETVAGSGNYTEINKYNMWVRVSDVLSGDIEYVDSGYFTPEGQDSGYVFP